MRSDLDPAYISELAGPSRREDAAGVVEIESTDTLRVAVIAALNLTDEAVSGGRETAAASGPDLWRAPQTSTHRRSECSPRRGAIRQDRADRKPQRPKHGVAERSQLQPPHHSAWLWRRTRDAGDWPCRRADPSIPWWRQRNASMADHREHGHMFLANALTSVFDVSQRVRFGGFCFLCVEARLGASFEPMFL